MSVTDKDLISAERYSHVFADIWNLVQCTSCLLGHFVRPHNACIMLKMAVNGGVQQEIWEVLIISGRVSDLLEH